MGYISGSILFIRVYEALFHKGDLTKRSEDGNPGAYNAYKNGGFVAGTFTVLGDILKGLIPVALFMNLNPEWAASPWSALVIAAPVYGHIYPLWNHFNGGKGIAVSFGVLLGLVPDWKPVLILAALFLFFTLIIVINPNSVRTMIVFLLLLPVSWLLHVQVNVLVAEVLISAATLVRIIHSEELLGHFQIRPIWNRPQEAEAHERT